jgi:cytochrome c-type biogenesis protein CcmE
MYKKKHAKLKFFIISFIICAIGIYIILYNLKDNIVFFYNPTEIKQKQISPTQITRVGGLVKFNSLVKQSKATEFTITDHNNDLKIITNSTLPAIFREGQGVVAKGYYRNNIFIADEILAKHDEKYMPKEVADSLKSANLWKEP